MARQSRKPSSLGVSSRCIPVLAAATRKPSCGLIEAGLLGVKVMVPDIVPRQIEAGREMLGWTRSDLATRSGVSERTIAQLEADAVQPGRRARAINALRIALEGAGIDFQPGKIVRR